MKLSLPTTWEDRMVDLARRLPVAILYGSLDRGPIGGGKPAEALPHVSRHTLEQHVRAVRDAGVSFTYLLNAPVSGNREYTPEGHRKLVDFVRYLRDVGVDHVTISSPQIMEIVRQTVPAMKLRGSAIACVDSPQKARYFDALGVTDITLDPNINRDFARLGAIRKAVSCELSLIVNEFCLFRCPMMQFHLNAIGAASQEGSPSGHVDTCALECKADALARPVEMIRSPWIRPEDLHRYEAIGIDRFKIAGRGKAFEFVERAATAYAARRFDGNLLQLLEVVERKLDEREYRVLDRTIATFPRLSRLGFSLASAVMARLDRSESVNRFSSLAAMPAERARRLVEAFYQLAAATETVTVDNQKLDGFISRFETTPCDDCTSCTHCEAFTRKAVTYDQAALDAAVKVVRALLADLAAGRV